jgi:hypothetical protein
MVKVVMVHGVVEGVVEVEAGTNTDHLKVSSLCE